MINRKQFFDMHAPKWDTYFGRNVLSKIKKHILPRLKIKKSSRVLDVGSGTGILLPYLKKAAGKNGEVVALDYSNRMLEKAREKYGDTFKYVCSNAEKVSFRPGYFDTIICYSVFPHFVNRIKVLKELYRVLIPGGRIIIAHADSRETINNHHRKIGTVVEHDQLPNDKIMLSLMQKAGFKNIIVDNEVNYYFAAGIK